MKSIFDNSVKQEVIVRIALLSANNIAAWGKMTVGQMIRHCSLSVEYYWGSLNVPRSFMGRLLGKSALKGKLKDENSLLQKNASTSSRFKVTDSIQNVESGKMI